MIVKVVELVDPQEMRKLTALETQDLSRTYLAHRPGKLTIGISAE